MTKAKVIEIQVGGVHDAGSLHDACRELVAQDETGAPPKIHFVILCPDGETRYITIRDEDEEVIAYGDFEGLPSLVESYFPEVQSTNLSNDTSHTYTKEVAELLDIDKEFWD